MVVALGRVLDKRVHWRGFLRHKAAECAMALCLCVVTDELVLDDDAWGRGRGAAKWGGCGWMQANRADWGAKAEIGANHWHPWLWGLLLPAVRFH